MRIIIQAGHEGRTSGSTGAPNEQSFNIDISNKVSEALRSKGFEIRRVSADPSAQEIEGDWDLFLSIHYDADVYGTGGYFVDFPEPSTDGATERSQTIAKILSDEYGNTTKIVNHPERSNKNTRYYYMWKSISAKTPRVLIECGVGMHVPDDHSILHFNRPLVAEGIVRGICKAFNIQYEQETINYKELYEKVINESQIKIMEMAQTYAKDKQILEEKIRVQDEALLNLQTTEHTWETEADKYQRLFKVTQQFLSDNNIQITSESTEDEIKGALSTATRSEEIANLYATIQTRLILSYTTPEAFLEALQSHDDVFIKQIDSLNDKIKELKKKQPSLWRFIINKYF